jgi:uncharacterized protein
VVVVASGPGLVGLYEELGAHIVDGGETMNPSTYDLLAAIHSVPAAEVVVLPNSPNVIMAADRAAELSERPACVVPTRSPQAGLAALVAFAPDRGAEENADALRQSLEAIRTGGVAKAARDDSQGRFLAGDAVGYAGEALVAWGEPEQVLAETMARVAEGCELLTCIAGADPPLGQEAVEGAVPEGVELEYHTGGQPAWWWLLSAE